MTSYLTYPASIILLLSVAACTDSAKPVEHDGAPATGPLLTDTAAPDTAGAYRVAGHWLKPSKSLEFNDSARLAADTLYLVACADYVYFPFGKIKDQAGLAQSKLKDFAVTPAAHGGGPGPRHYQLTRGGNQLELQFDPAPDPDEFWGSYLVAGRLQDGTVGLVNGLRVGMPASAFYAALFEQLDPRLQQQIRYVVLEPCVGGNPQHLYTVAAGKLSAIEFRCPQCGAPSGQ